MRVSLCLAVLLWSVSADAATLYVCAATGDDTRTKATAANSATPWDTIYRAAKGAPVGSPDSAAQAADAGDLVVVCAGTYAAPAADSRFINALNPVNEGTSDGNRITFQCATAQACVTTTSSLTGPAFGASGRDYITWDGFYVDEANAPSHADTGPVVCHDNVGCEILNSYIDGNGNGHGEMDNHNGIRLEDTTDGRIANNTITNVTTISNPNNGACVMTYAIERYIIEHNSCSASGSGFFLKGGPHVDFREANIIRYNVAFDLNASGGAYIAHAGAPTTEMDPTLIYQNIAYNVGRCLVLWNFGSEFNDPTSIKFVNNTCYGNTYGLYQSGEAVFATDAANLLQNNIIVLGDAAIASELAGTTWQDPTTFTAEHNIYFGYTVAFGRFNLEATPASVTVAAWQLSPYSHDATSPTAGTGDPLFVNAAIHDFRLQGGSYALTQGRVIYGIGGSDGATIPAGAYITGLECIGPETACVVAAAFPVRLRQPVE